MADVATTDHVKLLIPILNPRLIAWVRFSWLGGRITWSTRTWGSNSDRIPSSNVFKRNRTGAYREWLVLRIDAWISSQQLNFGVKKFEFFENMFQHLMKENLTYRVVMEDIEPDVFGLAYSFTSSTPVWNPWLKWTHLLLDSMQMQTNKCRDQLKSACENHLIRRLMSGIH